jgi:hypothetical protein
MYNFFKSLFSGKEARLAALNSSADYLGNLSFPKWAGIMLVGNGAWFLFYWRSQSNDDPSISFARTVSRAIGRIATKEIPQSLRKPLLGSYSSVYEVPREDMIEPNLENYKNFQEFFTRQTKPRQFSVEHSHLISPADSRVLSFTEITEVTLSE